MYCRYPAKQWEQIGIFQGQDVKGLQTFRIGGSATGRLIKYVKVSLASPREPALEVILPRGLIAFFPFFASSSRCSITTGMSTSVLSLWCVSSVSARMRWTSLDFHHRHYRVPRLPVTSELPWGSRRVGSKVRMPTCLAFWVIILLISPFAFYCFTFPPSGLFLCRHVHRHT